MINLAYTIFEKGNYTAGHIICDNIRQCFSMHIFYACSNQILRNVSALKHVRLLMDGERAIIMIIANRNFEFSGFIII